MLVASADAGGFASRLAGSRCFVFIDLLFLSFSKPWPNVGLQAHGPLLYMMVPGEGSIRQAVFVKERRQLDVGASPFDPAAAPASQLVSGLSHRSAPASSDRPWERWS